MNADFGSFSFSFSEEGSDPGQRRALTRALASESRNALARVELAASELARSELTPGVAGRVATIRAAAEEIHREVHAARARVLGGSHPRTLGSSRALAELRV